MLLSSLADCVTAESHETATLSHGATRTQGDSKWANVQNNEEELNNNLAQGA